MYYYVLFIYLNSLEEQVFNSVILCVYENIY